MFAESVWARKVGMRPPAHREYRAYAPAGRWWNRLWVADLRKGKNKVTGILSFGDIFKAFRQSLLNCDRRLHLICPIEYWQSDWLPGRSPSPWRNTESESGRKDRQQWGRSRAHKGTFALNAEMRTAYFHTCWPPSNGYNFWHWYADLLYFTIFRDEGKNAKCGTKGMQNQ